MLVTRRYVQKKDLYQTIASLEKGINGLKEKNQELEKFKFVLDYKINKLKKQIKPREQQISEMGDRIQQIDWEN